MNEPIKLAGASVAGAVAGGLMMMGAAVGAETIDVKDDGVSALNVQKVIVTESAMKSDVTFDGTINDIISELASLDRQIVELQAKRTQLVSLKAKIQTEVNKLPARAIEAAPEI